MRRFHRERYHPANAALVVVGDVGAGELRRVLEEKLAGWRPRPAAPPAVRAADPGRRAPLVLRPVPGMKHAALHFGALLPNEAVDDAASALLARALQDALRGTLRTQGLAYDVRVSVSPVGVGRFLHAETSVEPAVVSSAMDWMKDELRRLRDRPLPTKWLEHARRSVMQQTVARLQTREGIEATLVEALLDGRADGRPFSRAVQAIAASRPEDLQRLAAAHLREETLAWGVAGDWRKLPERLAGIQPVDWEQLAQGAPPRAPALCSPGPRR